MTPNGNPLPSDRENEKSYPVPILFDMRMVTVGAEVGCATLLIVLAAVFGGIWLDRILGTKPIFTILLVLGSAPFSLVLTFWLAKRSIKDTTPPTTRQPGAVKQPRAAGGRGRDYDEEGDDNW